MKYFKLKIVLIFFFCFFISCSKKDLEISGYGYKGDSVFVIENKKVILVIPIDCNIDSNGMCSFYEKKLKIKDVDVKLNFKIISNGISVLDTSFIIPKRNKNPFVSFVYPSSKSNYKRVLLLDDDSKYVKY